MKTKTCKKCGQNKKYTKFWKDIHLLDGYTSSCKDCINELRRIRYKKKNQNKISKRKKKTKEEIKEYRKIWRLNNPDKMKKYRQKRKNKNNLWKQQQLKTNPLFRMRRNISDYMRKIIKSNGGIKSKKMEDILGIKFSDYLQYLENLFENGMTWQNWTVDGWHIDHIIPLCSAKNEKELLELFHYTNTRPLWAKDNFSKGGKHPSIYF